jgi:type IV pilus assembly protein PilM
VFKRKQSSATVVGLELDPSHIAAAEVAVNGSITVKRGAVAPLRPGLLRDGEAHDPAALADALKAFFAEHQLPNRVRVGIATSASSCGRSTFP